VTLGEVLLALLELGDVQIDRNGAAVLGTKRDIFSTLLVGLEF
jgi:hypothetical protein